MARVVGVEESRNIQLQLAPDAIRGNMLRNCLRFKLIKDPTDPKQLGFMPDVIKEFLRGLHDSTTGLFSLITDNEDDYHLAQTVFETRIYFETPDDMESFKRNFLLKYKLGH